MALFCGRAEERDRGSAESTGGVDESGVSADAERGLGEERQGLADGVPRRVDAFHSRRGVDGLRDVALPGPAHEDRREALTPESIREASEPFRRPDLRRPLRADAESSEGTEMTGDEIDRVSPCRTTARRIGRGRLTARKLAPGRGTSGRKRGPARCTRTTRGAAEPDPARNLPIRANRPLGPSGGGGRRDRDPSRGGGAEKAARAPIGTALVEHDGARRPRHGEHDVVAPGRDADVDPRRGEAGADRVDQRGREDHVSEERRLDDENASRIVQISEPKPAPYVPDDAPPSRGAASSMSMTGIPSSTR